MHSCDSSSACGLQAAARQERQLEPLPQQTMPAQVWLGWSAVAVGGLVLVFLAFGGRWPWSRSERKGGHWVADRALGGKMASACRHSCSTACSRRLVVSRMLRRAGLGGRQACPGSFNAAARAGPASPGCSTQWLLQCCGSPKHVAARLPAAAAQQTECRGHHGQRQRMAHSDHTACSSLCTAAQALTGLALLCREAGLRRL